MINGLLQDFAARQAIGNCRQDSYQPLLHSSKVNRALSNYLAMHALPRLSCGAAWLRTCDTSWAELALTSPSSSGCFVFAVSRSSCSAVCSVLLPSQNPKPSTLNLKMGLCTWKTSGSMMFSPMSSRVGRGSTLRLSDASWSSSSSPIFGTSYWDWW